MDIKLGAPKSHLLPQTTSPRALCTPDASLANLCAVPGEVTTPGLLL